MAIQLKIKTYPYGIYLGLTALIGAIIGASIAVDIDGDTFKRFLAIIMITIGIIIVFNTKINIISRTCRKVKR